MEEEAQTNFMHLLTLGKREGLAHKTRQALPQGVVPALDVVGLSRFFAPRAMLLLGQHGGIAVPKVALQQAAFVSRWNPAPQHATGRFTAVTQGGCGA